MFRFFALAGLAAISFGASAAQPLQCNSCITDADFKARAVRDANLNGGGEFWVYNLKDNIAQKWRIVTSGPVDPPGTVSRAAAGSAKLPLEPEVSAEVNAGHTLYIIGGNSTRPLYNVPIEHLQIPAASGKSVYDVMLDGNLKGQIESKLGDTAVLNSIVNANVIASLIDVAQMATNHLGLKEGSFLNFRVVLEDGTYIDVHLDIAKTTGDVQEDTARTQSGQVVPAGGSELNGKWNYSPADNLGALADYFAGLGAVMVETGEQGGIVTGISCIAARCQVVRQRTP